MRITLAALALVCLPTIGAGATEFTMSSPVSAGGFTNENVLSASAGFGCAGGNLSPAVTWSGVPANTKSLVVTIFDKDAPTGSGFWHWIVVDIPPTATGLPAGAGSGRADLPRGAAQTRTDLGVPGYVGPCPPVGTTHDYVFTVTALDIDKLPVAADTMPAVVGFMTNAHATAKATTTVRHGR